MFWRSFSLMTRAATSAVSTPAPKCVPSERLHLQARVVMPPLGRTPARACARLALCRGAGAERRGPCGAAYLTRLGAFGSAVSACFMVISCTTGLLTRSPPNIFSTTLLDSMCAIFARSW